MWSLVFSRLERSFHAIRHRNIGRLCLQLKAPTSHGPSTKALTNQHLLRKFVFLTYARLPYIAANTVMY